MLTYSSTDIRIQSVDRNVHAVQLKGDGKVTNTSLLKKKIETTGLKISYIADFVGISRQLLWKKLNNKTFFNQYEIEKMCKVLEITDLNEKEAIFFAIEVD